MVMKDGTYSQYKTVSFSSDLLLPHMIQLLRTTEVDIDGKDGY